MKKLLLGLLLSVGGVGFASDCCQMSCCSDPCASWELSADYLYWKPTRTNLAYAAHVQFNANLFYNDRGIAFIDPEWNSGYRFALSRNNAGGCWEMGIRYTHFSSKTQDRADIAVQDQDGLAALLPLAFAEGFNQLSRPSVTGKYSLDFDVVDAFIGSALRFDCLNLCLGLSTGFKYASIDETFSSFDLSGLGSNQVLTIGTRHNCLDAYGVGFALDKHWGFCCDRFWYASRVGGGILYGDVAGSWLYSLETTGAVDITNSWNDIVTMLEVSVGLGGNIWCGACASLSLEIGYEFQSWWIPPFLDIDAYMSTFSNNFSPETNLQTARLGLSGLYIRAGLAF